MKKRIFSMLLAFAMIFSMMPTAFAATTYQVVTVDKSSISEGDTVNVKVTLPTGIETAGSFTVNMNFDKEKFEVTSFKSTKINSTDGDGEADIVSPVKGTLATANEQGVLKVNAAYTYNTMQVAGVTVIDATLKAKTGVSGVASFGFDIFEITKSDGTTQYIVKKDQLNTPPSVTILKAPLTSVSASVDQPVKETALDTTVDLGSASAYTAAVEWYEGSAATGTAVTGNAKAETVYTAKITLTANDGESFATALNATNIGGYAVVRTDATHLVLTKTFAKTDDKTTPTITTLPTASAITYRQTLADSTLTGGAASVTGTFAWKEGTTAPQVSDSNATEYDVIFTPSDTDNYTTATCKVKLTVNPKTLVVTNANFFGLKESYVYRGTSIAPTFTLKDGEETIDGYTTNYSDNTNVGTATITITDVAGGNYNVSGSATFRITPKAGNITIANPSKITYDGNNVEAGLTGSGKDLTYTYDGDGSVNVTWYNDNNGTKGSSMSSTPKDAGTYWIGVSAAAGSNYQEVSEVSKKFTIERATYTYTRPDTDTATIGNAVPSTDTTVTATGVNSESVSGKLEWFTNSSRTIKATGTFDKVGTKTLYWKFTPNSSENNYVTTPKIGTVAYTVNALPQQNVSFDIPNALTKTYGDASFINSATNNTYEGVPLTYSGNKDSVATVDASTGEVTIKHAGTVTITATAAEVPGYYAETKVSYTLTVNKKSITPTIEVSGSYTYNGNPITPNFTVKDGSTELDETDYQGMIEDNIDAGTATITVQEYEGGNYTFAVASTTFTIQKANHADETATGSAKYGAAGTVDLSSLIVAGGTATFDSSTDSNSVLSGIPSVSGNTLNFAFVDDTGKIDESAQIVLNVTSENYANYKITVDVTVTAKTPQVVTASDVTVTYGDTGAKVVGTTNGDGTITYVVKSGGSYVNVNGTSGELTIIGAGGAKVEVRASETAEYASAFKKITVTINKATPTGKPSCTKITEDGKTIADAVLSRDGLTPSVGTIEWINVEGGSLDSATTVEKNKAYKWLFTPTDPNYTTLEGTLTPYYVAPSGGGGGFIPAAQKPEIKSGEGGKVTLSTDGTTAAITPDEGKLIDKVLLNGKDMGDVKELKGLKTGDKVEVSFKDKVTEPTKEELDENVKETVKNSTPAARSAKLKNGNIKVTVKGDFSEIEKLGYTVKYKFYRSTKKSSGYKAMREGTTGTYINSKGAKGSRYYYKARVMVYDKEGKLVAKSSLKQCKYATRIWTK